MEFNAFVEETKETYKIYQVEHEKILGDIVEDIDIINRKKNSYERLSSYKIVSNFISNGG